MFDLYKANMMRLVRNPFYRFGCVAALVITFIFTSGVVTLPFLASADKEIIMFFMSAAMVAYFTVFVPLFTNPEYSDGVIRNKVLSGRMQTEIYLSYLLTHLSAAVIMWICYMLGGIFGGANPFRYFAANLVILIAVFNYIATMMVVAFRIKKIIVVVIGVAVIFNTCFDCVMMGNFVLMVTEGKPHAQYMMALLYNVNALGQWFSHTGFSDDVANPGVPAQIILSAVVIAVMTLVGLCRLNKRDIV